MRTTARSRLAIIVALLAGCAVAGGCTVARQRLATEQLLLSDAVDQAVSKIDFTSLAGRRVFLDPQYLQNVNGIGFVNGPYVISSLRQQMSAAGCLLQDKVTEAEFVVEARVGTLGADAHEVTYGVPASANNTVASAASFVPNVPSLPALPDFALARRYDLRGAAKLGVFAYHRETRVPVWQSGISLATNNTRDGWVFGAGPIQSDTAHERAKLVARSAVPSGGLDVGVPPNLVSYYDAVDFTKGGGKLPPHLLRVPKPVPKAAEPLVTMPQLLPFSQEAIAPRAVWPPNTPSGGGAGASGLSATTASPATNPPAPFTNPPPGPWPRAPEAAWPRALPEVSEAPRDESRRF